MHFEKEDWSHVFQTGQFSSDKTSITAAGFFSCLIYIFVILLHLKIFSFHFTALCAIALEFRF